MKIQAAFCGVTTATKLILGAKFRHVLPISSRSMVAGPICRSAKTSPGKRLKGRVYNIRVLSADRKGDST